MEFFETTVFLRNVYQPLYSDVMASSKQHTTLTSNLDLCYVREGFFSMVKALSNSSSLKKSKLTKKKTSGSVEKYKQFTQSGAIMSLLKSVETYSI